MNLYIGGKSNKQLAKFEMKDNKIFYLETFFSVSGEGMGFDN